MDSDLDEIINEAAPVLQEEIKQESDTQDTSEDEAKNIFTGKEKIIKKLNELTKGVDYEVDKLSKVPAWHDEDDEDESDTEVKPVKRRKVDRTEREKQLKRVVGEPAWVKPPEDDSSDDELLKTANQILEPSKDKLRQNILGFKRVKDLNRSTYSEKRITSIIFHPTSTVAICTGENGIANIYAVDGKQNEKLHSVAFNDFQITSASLLNGQELIVGGRKHIYYTYDLISGKSEQINLRKPVTNLKHFRLSPCGKHMAVIGRFGEVHLFDTKTKELVKTYKQEHPCTALDFTKDSKKLFCHSDSDEISVFDLSAARLMHRWVDVGCVNGTTITTTDTLIATGNRQGVVNIYDINDVYITKYPQSKKSIMNLTTSITSTVFNPTAEILGISSVDVNDAVRLIHFPSLTSFSNFPGSLSKLGRPTVMAFSPMSGYLAIGSVSKTVALYRLKHYNNY